MPCQRPLEVGDGTPHNLDKSVVARDLLHQEGVQGLPIIDREARLLELEIDGLWDFLLQLRDEVVYRSRLFGVMLLSHSEVL